MAKEKLKSYDHHTLLKMTEIEHKNFLLTTRWSDKDVSETESCKMTRVKCGALRSPAKETPLIKLQFSQNMQRFQKGKAKFTAKVLPDSGTTKTVISHDIAVKKGIT